MALYVIDANENEIDGFIKLFSNQESTRQNMHEHLLYAAMSENLDAKTKDILITAANKEHAEAMKWKKIADIFKLAERPESCRCNK